jgi:hypothetical protein
VSLVLSVTLRVVMDDGSQQDFSKNYVMLPPPGYEPITPRRRSTEPAGSRQNDLPVLSPIAN